VDFGQALASLRQRSRLSQLQLAGLSGVSQRHISFLESGRSNPGQASVTKLAHALELSHADTNFLYACAGLSCPRPAFDFADPEFEPARRAIGQLLRSHVPSPAIATLRGGEIVMANEAFNAALGWAFEGKAPWRKRAARNDNLYDLTLHPEGLRRFMANPEEVIPHTLRRLRVAARADEAARSILARAEGYPGIRNFSDIPEPKTSSGCSVLVERYLVRGQALNLVSMVASFGSPEDVTAQALQIELFFAADGETGKALSAISQGLTF
jgi:transcriptional regulator with XRE-family HTH domain